MNLKQLNLYLNGLSERKKKEKEGQKKIFEETVTENFQI